MVGDSSAPFARTSDTWFLERIRSTKNLPKASRFRLGLLIPAAATNTFSNYLVNYTGTKELPDRTPSRLILGLNKKDAPTNKYLLTCKISGDTCMNTRAHKACQKITKAFEQAPQLEFRVYEFSDSKMNEDRSLLFWEEHSVTSQMRRDRWAGFIGALLSEVDLPADDRERVCRRD